MQTTLIHLRRHTGGSLLITAAVTSAILAILIGGGLTYIGNEYMLNLRSHRWHQALHLAEAGIEMSFAEFNNYYRVGSNAFTSARGWSPVVLGLGYRRACTLTNSAGEPVGLITNYVWNVGGSNPYLQAEGYCHTTPRGPVVGRRVTCFIFLNSQFPAAMVAKNRIDMNGNNVYTDSYDSSNPAKSTGGRYDPAKKQPNGDIASTDTITNTVDVSIGNANIYGSVLLSPSGSVTMGPNGTIGPTFSNPATTVAAAQTAGWVRNDFQVDIPPVVLPTGAASWYSVGSLDTETLNSGDYRATDISPKNKETLTINGDVRIYVTGNIDIKGTVVVNPGASLIIYAAGNMSIRGNGVVNNSANAMSTQFYGLDTCTSISVQGNGAWCGVIYAPNAAVSIGGGGSSGIVSGSVVGKSITMNGHVEFHYDEALRSAGPKGNYNIASWKSSRWTGSGWVEDN